MTSILTRPHPNVGEDRRAPEPLAALARRAPEVDMAYLRGVLGGDDPDAVIRTWARLADEDEPTGTAGRH